MKEFEGDSAAYDEAEKKLEEELKPLLTEEFLKVLVQAARTYGWSGDYYEVHNFVEYLYDLHGVEGYELGEPFLNP